MTKTTAARSAAWAACALGVGYAAVSVYWGFGGTGLLDTVGGSLARAGRAGGVTVLLAVWAAAALKLVAAVLPLLARHGVPGTRRLAWVGGVILTGYGAVLTGAGLLVQSGAVSTHGADRHALAWHAALWDPWFLVWGLLTIAALVLSRPQATSNRRAPLPVPSA